MTEYLQGTLGKSSDVHGGSLYGQQAQSVSSVIPGHFLILTVLSLTDHMPVYFNFTLRTMPFIDCMF